jgi:hypothetical protein
MVPKNLPRLLLVGAKLQDVEIDIEFSDTYPANGDTHLVASSLQMSDDTDRFQQRRSDYP